MRSEAIKMTWFVLVSSEQVLAPGMVSTVCSTSKVFGSVSLMIVSLPSPVETKASIVFGLNAARRPVCRWAAS